jgi:hypothetical protein
MYLVYVTVDVHISKARKQSMNEMKELKKTKDTGNIFFGCCQMNLCGWLGMFVCFCPFIALFFFPFLPFFRICSSLGS